MHTLEERRTFQERAIPGGIVSVGTSEAVANDNFDKPDGSEDVLDDGDNVVIIVDLVDHLRSKKRDKKEENHNFGLTGEVPRLESVQRRRDQEKDDMGVDEKNSISKDKKVMTFSTKKGTGCSLGNEMEKRREPETSSITATQHSTGSSVKVDIVEDLQTTQSLFNWDDFGYSLILGFAPTAWDVFSDLTIADELTESGEVISAGLTYLFICFPGLLIFSEAL